MKRVHIAPQYMLTPQHPVTINLIGAGGTGSQVLTCLGRMDATLAALGHPGFHVRVYDPDKISAANIGRQLFSPADSGLNKAVCLTTRLNRFFGIAWEAVPEMFSFKSHGMANIFITCTDNILSRISLNDNLDGKKITSHTDHNTPLYWLDFGNTQQTGQVVLGSKSIPQPKSKKYKTVEKLKSVTELFDYSKLRDEDSGPSCSLAAALDKQDLFINSTLAQLGCDILWKLFREGMVEYQGLYLNLTSMNMNPIKL